MKIMFLVPMINSDDIERYKRNREGLAYTTRSIVEKIAEFGHEVSVFAQSGFSKGFVNGNIKYEKKQLYHIFPLPIRYIVDFFKDSYGCKFTIRRWVHAFSYYLYGGYVERLLVKNKPDIVSIRGIGYYTKPFINACERTNTKYVVSLHGLISFLDENQVTNKEKEMERQLFLDAINNRHVMTVIASGIKKRMLKELGANCCDEIIVVNNGIDKNTISFSIEEIEMVKRKYSIQPNNKVLMSAAHIAPRKNQVQIVRAISMLPQKTKDNIKLLVLGDGEQKKELEQLVSSLHLEDTVKFCGFIPNEEIGIYYSVSDANIIASLDEGFGRAFVEAFLYGIPTITFKDLDAVEDLYSEDALVCVEERTDEALANAIQYAIQRDWDKSKIIKHGEKFSITNMAKKYVEIYARLAQ